MSGLWTEQLIQSAFNYLSKNPNHMLQIPEVRTIVANERYTKNKSNISVLEGGSPYARDKSIEHNFNNLQSLSGLDRGTTLIYPLLQTEEMQLYSRHIKCLCIGPRNEAELLGLAGYGVQEENIKGLDLISYSDFVEVGDMHDIPFDNNKFDIVIAGWVLAYSTNIEVATNEIMRVLRPGGLVSVGWDMSRKDQPDAKNKYKYSEKSMMDKSQAHNAESTVDIVDMFKRASNYIEILSNKNASAPYDHITRRNMVAFRVHRAGQSYKIQNSLYRDDFSLRILIEHLRSNNSQGAEIVEKLRQSLYREDTSMVDDSYLEFRREYFSHAKSKANLSELLDSAIRILSPPTYTQRFLGTGSNSNFPSTIISLESSDIKEIVETIRREGYAKAPISLDSKTVDIISEYLKLVSFKTRDNEGVRFQCFKGPGRALASTEHLIQIPNILEIGLSDAFVGVAEQFLDVTPIFENVSLAYSIGKSKNQSDQNRDAQLFHRDKDRPSFLKIFIYLNDVGENDGPHAVVKGSHIGLDEKNLIDRRFSTEEINQLYPDKIVSITGPKGTIFFVNTHAFHCGLPIESESSRLLLCYQYSSSMIGASFSKMNARNMNVRFPNLDNLTSDYPRIFQNMVIE